MANPVFVTCTKNAWTKVATNVTTGNIYKNKAIDSQYLHTYKMTGESAPTLISVGVRAFEDSLKEEIGADAAIDIYIWVVGAIDGEVMVAI